MTKKSVGQGVFAFSVLVIGGLTAAFAGSEAYDGADATDVAVETYHPVFEAVINLGLPLLLVIVAALTMISFGVLLFKSKPSGVNLR